MKEYKVYKDLFIPLIIVTENNLICDIYFSEDDMKDSMIENETDNHKQCYQQLQEYFEGKRKEFDLPINISGTDFEKSVYHELLNIPFGQTISYKELAHRINHEKAFRAVGNANGKNRLPIIIPCHRVIASNNQLGGYSGGLDIKKTLLEVEGIIL